MQSNDIGWSPTEQDIAHEAFTKAYDREITALLQEVRKQANEIILIEDLWRLHDFLSARRHDIDGKYEYKYPMLIFVFARLIQEQWLHLEDLQGLAPDKLAKISALVRM
jgi:hypothetical protein